MDTIKSLNEKLTAASTRTEKAVADVVKLTAAVDELTSRVTALESAKDSPKEAPAKAAKAS